MIMRTEQTMTVLTDKSVEDAFAATEHLGLYYGLEKKQVLHLRLLAEELFGLKLGIEGNTKAEYKITGEDKNFELRLKTEVDMTDEMREKFIAASSSGKNAAAVTHTASEIIARSQNLLLLLKECKKTYSDKISSIIKNMAGIEIFI